MISPKGMIYMSNTKMSRRDVLAASGAFVVAAGVSATASAEMNHADHMADGMLMHQAVVDAALDCVRKGNLCLDHCLVLFQANDTSVANCAVQVKQMLPLCDTLSKLAMADSKYLKQLARLCIETCSDCEKECRKHADKHAACKACADSCAACIKACKALLV